MTLAEERQFGRRGFLGGAGLLALGGLTACGLVPATTQNVDVVVVGAGLSGLCAATGLVASGVSCVVLEAQDHVGGRMVRQAVAENGWIDLGGQWMGPTQTALFDLARSLGVSYFDSYDKGDGVLYFEGVRSTVSGDFQQLSAGTNITGTDVAAYRQLSGQLDRLAETVNITSPRLTPSASSLDGLTVSQWLDANSSSAFAKFVVGSTISANGDDPGQISMLYLLYSNATGPQSENPEKWLFDGAAGQIPPILAAKLGDQILLNQPVYAIRQDSSGVQVTTPAGRYDGKFVIVAVPPHLAGAIDYEPAMPPVRLQLTQRFPMQSIIKNACTYPSAWWREAGLSGTALLPTVHAADSSPPSGRPGILTSFFSAPASITLEARTPQQRKADTISSLVTCFGPKAAEPAQYIEANWPASKWVGGAFNAFMGPGVLTTFGDALRAPVDRIHWAGTEAATRWMGYFDGAVRAGQAAASAVMSRL
jgi:monoamine oxidase